MSYLLIFILFIWIWSLQSKVSGLESQFKNGHQVAAAKSVTSAPAQPAFVVQTQPQVKTQTPAEVPVVEREPGFDFVAWFKEDWLLKLGIGLVIIGLGWFVSYAFANNWIGEVGRITLGLVTSTLVLAFGWWRMVKVPNQGASFMVLGEIGIIMTTLAGQYIYSFFSEFTSLGIIFASLVFVTLASVQFRRLPLAVVSLILAGLAPSLAHVSGISSEGLFLYLLIVVTGMLWAVVYTGWRPLVFTSLAIVSIYSFGFMVGGETNYFILGIIFLMSLMFFVSHTIGVTRTTTQNINSDLITSFLNGLLVLSLVLDQIPTNWQSLTLAAWAVVFAVGAFIVNKLTSRHEPFFIYGGISLVFVGVATAVELSGAALTVAFILEAIIFVLGVFFVTRDLAATRKSSWIFIIPAMLATSSIVSRSWQTSLVNEDFFVLLLLIGALSLIGFFFQSKEGFSLEDKKLNTASVFYVIGSVYTYILIWLALHVPGILPANLATMAALVVYTVVGLMAYSYGRMQAVTGMITYGGVLLAFVVGRLLIVDVWLMPLGARVVTFFLIGALLISTAFIGRGKHQDNS